MSTDLTRRHFLKQTAVLLTPVLLAGSAAVPAKTAASRLRVVCVGAHPDDPESGCAGTLAHYAQAGDEVSVVYLTRGERGIRDKGLRESATLRSGEAETACKVIKAKPLFFGEIDGATEVNQEQVQRMAKLIESLNPDVLFAHWPIDTHMDHQVASLLTLRAYYLLRRLPELYFFEVNTGSQSEGFYPNTYVDISQVLETKKRALFAHASQDGRAIWTEHHEVVARWRGREVGVEAAEAFVHLNRTTAALKPPRLGS